MINLKELPFWPESKLKAHAFILVGHGVLPLEQWVGVFSHQDYHPWPNLRCKAFTVWFPTMVDYLKSEPDFGALQKELADRKVNIQDLSSIAGKLNEHFRKVLSLFDRHEQLFLNDRRLQNVHGRLSTFIIEEHKVPWFNGESQRVEKTNLSADAYHTIMTKFYPKMQESEMALLDRLLQSEPFRDLYTLYEAKLRVQDRLIPLARELGIFKG